MLDATGKYVIPGGVDVHTHMELPFGGTNASDTFETGTIARRLRAAPRSIVDFAVQRTGEDVHDGLAAWHEKADGNCAIDYGFHQIIGGVDDAALKAMSELTNNEGVTSFKLFMAYPGVFYSDDGQILRAMQTASDLGATIMMHAENGPAIDVLVAQALERGETDPRYHSLTRPVEMEEEATHRAIMLAKVAKAPLYIVHVSCREAVETIARARGMGANVFAETCPQYLYLSLEEHLSKPGFEGAAYVCSTPLRSRAEGHQDSLWQALRTNDVSVVSTDHCPFCMKDQKELGLGNFSKIPNGIGSVEHRMDLLYQGVVTGEITLPRWVELASTTPARMFGLYPRKGVIAPGLGRRRRDLRPQGHDRHQREDAPHEHGPFGLRGHARRRSRRDRAVARSDRRREQHVHAARSGTGSSCDEASASTWCRRAPPRDSSNEGNRSWSSGSYCRPIRRPLASSNWPRAPRRSASLRLDLRLAHLVGGAVRHLQPDTGLDALASPSARWSRIPATRDWTVTASLFATLNEMYGNRTVCGIGRGDSAVRVTNGKPTTLATLRDSIHVIRELANGRSVDYHGSMLHFPWVVNSELEVWVAAYGPKALTLAGEVGDGFILQLADPDIAKWMIAAVREAAANAGRDPKALTFCVAAPAYVGDGPGPPTRPVSLVRGHGR